MRVIDHYKNIVFNHSFVKSEQNEQRLARLISSSALEFPDRCSRLSRDTCHILHEQETITLPLQDSLLAIAMENFNEHFKAIFVYQLALLYRFEHGLELCVGLKAFLKAA